MDYRRTLTVEAAIGIVSTFDVVKFLREDILCEACNADGLTPLKRVRGSIEDRAIDMEKEVTQPALNQ